LAAGSLFDVASPFQVLPPGNEPDPFKSLDFELGVHGTPFKGFWYDVGLFWMEFDNRTETRQFSPIDFIIVNTGSTRHRGLEGELSYDFLARFQHPPLVTTQPEPGKDVKDAKVAAVPGVPIEGFHPLQLIAFSNVQFLDAEFTGSDIPDQVGKTPALPPTSCLKAASLSGSRGVSTLRSRAFMLHSNSGPTWTFHFQPFPQKFLPTKSSTFQVNTTSLGMCD
jgi:Fe(3+) dicitrate transport protein